MHNRYLAIPLLVLLSSCAAETSGTASSQDPLTPIEDRPSTLSVSCPDGAPPPVREGAVFCTCSSGETLVTGFRAGDRFCLSNPTIFIDALRYGIDAASGSCIDIVSSPDVSPSSVHGNSCFYPAE